MRGEGSLLAVVALGGGIGALARYGIAHAMPTREIPWATLITNVIGCLLIGVPSAWAITRLKLPAPALWRALATLPLAIPSYVAAFAWVATWPGVSGFWPAAVILTLACAPYVTLPVAAALTMADSRYTDAARTLGAGPARVLTRVTLPRIAPAAGNGTVGAIAMTGARPVFVDSNEGFTIDVSKI